MFYKPAQHVRPGSSATASRRHRKGQLQLIDGQRLFGRRMRKSLGSKRKELSPDTLRNQRLFAKCVEAQRRRANQPPL